jgi:hypothetical protein
MKRLIPVILVLLFAAAGCTTVNIYEQRGGETTDVTTDHEMPEEVNKESVNEKNTAGTGAISVLTINIDKDFDYIPSGWPMGLSVGYTDTSVLSDTPFKPFSREPSYRSYLPKYGYLTLGNSRDNRISFVIDYLDQTTWWVWFDVNNNGDLTDDGPGLTPHDNPGVNVSFNVPVITASESLKRPYRIWFWITDKNGTLFPRYYAVCHYRKKLDIGGRNYDAVVFEKFGHNALYRNSGLWIDLNGDGKLDKKREHFSNNAVVTTGGRKFRLKMISP